MAEKKVRISFRTGVTDNYTVKFSLRSLVTTILVAALFIGCACTVLVQAVRTNMLLALFDDESPEALYQRKAEFLADETIRIKNYEKELRDKTQSIESLVKEVKSLQYKTQTQTQAATDSKGKHISWRQRLGLGGREENISSVELNSQPKLELQQESEVVNRSSKQFLSLLDEYEQLLRSMPIGTPVQGELASGFGIRRSPFTHILQIHSGLDIDNEYNTPIAATAPGRVSFAGWDGAYGQSVIIDHGNGIQTQYAHLTRIITREGAVLNRGALVGTMGSTGRSTGSHLHYEVRVNGKAVDPMRFVELAGLLNTAQF